MGNDLYEENKRLKRLLDETEALLLRDRERAAEKANLMGERMADFFIALAEGRVILERFNGNVPTWRVAILETKDG